LIPTHDLNQSPSQHIYRPPCGLVDTHSTSTSVPETAEEALYLLEVARADLEVRRLEKDLAERLLHQLLMRKHYLELQADKAKRNFGAAEVNVGCTRALVTRGGFVCPERSLGSPRPRPNIELGELQYASQDMVAQADVQGIRILSNFSFTADSETHMIIYTYFYLCSLTML
jgi:hypothetical protein